MKFAPKHQSMRISGVLLSQLNQNIQHHHTIKWKLPVAKRKGLEEKSIGDGRSNGEDSDVLYRKEGRAGLRRFVVRKVCFYLFFLCLQQLPRRTEGGEDSFDFLFLTTPRPLALSPTKLRAAAESGSYIS